nr:LOW QUALITY PROTEIN: galactose-specific lectin nattectin-like [Pseudochaenichthys georgianus]
MTIATLAAAASATSSDHHSKMESGVYCIVLLCLTSGLWMEADATANSAGYFDCRGSCPPEWTQLGSRCFIFKNQPMNWASAERDCLGLGGNLASFQSTTEFNFIRKLVRTATGQDLHFWAGGHDAVMEGVWLWSDGSKFSFSGWGKGEPNNYRGKEHCMEVNFGDPANKKVNDQNCLDKQPFVCSSSLK